MNSVILTRDILCSGCEVVELNSLYSKLPWRSIRGGALSYGTPIIVQRENYYQIENEKGNLMYLTKFDTKEEAEEYLK